MSSSNETPEKHSTDESTSYKPGTVRYHDLPPERRKKLYEDRQIELNPCHKESEIATGCLITAGEDFQQCYAQIENYKTCKRFWTAVRSFATVNHLSRGDSFPPLSERPIWKKQLGSWIQTKKLTIPEELKPLI